MTAVIKFKTTVTSSGNSKYSLQGDLDGALTLEEQFRMVQRSLITIAKQALSGELQKGFDSKYRTFVDNQPNKPIDNVKPFGKIEFIARSLAKDILVPIYLDLLQLSPYKSGTYKMYHWVYYNGILVANNMDKLKFFVENNPIKDGDTIQFVDVVPYAGVLEREGVIVGGQGTGRKMVKSKDKRLRSGPKVRRPNGTYYHASRLAVEKYGKSAHISFRWMPGSTLGLTNLPSVSKTGKPLRNVFAKGINKGKPYVYPTIRVYFKQGALV